jgi:ABC-type multidrug transport system permease subunit
MEWLAYSDPTLAINRIRYHQLDILLDPENQRYWVNPESSRGRIAEQLLHATGPLTLQRQAIAGRAVRYVDWALPGILGMNMMFASLFGVGYVVVRYRMNGVLKRLRATPTNAFEFLASQILSRLTVIIAASAIIFIGCNWALDFLMLGSYLDLLVVGMLGGMAMISLGLVISSRTDSEEFAGGMLNLCTWPMMFLSEVWFSLDNAPAYVRAFAETLPLTHLVAGARRIMLEGATLTDISHHVIALIITTVVLMTLASLLFRWQRD